jgi:glucose/mannose-6-phosphate isomerase
LNSNKTNGLDDLRVFGIFDREGMLKHLQEFPSECKKAFDMAEDFSLPSIWTKVGKIVILGMGGSAIGGDLANSLAVTTSKVPIQVIRGYNLPAYADKNTLVISSSYSGNTEETLNCFTQSLEAGCQNLVITTGGKLRELAESRKVPVFSYDYQSPPRYALPYSFIPLLVFLNKLDLVSYSTPDITEMLKSLQDDTKLLSERTLESENPAKLLAQKLYDKIPIIYGAETVSEVAHRWKTQLNENSKAWAFYDVLPELNHNSVVGYEYPIGTNNNLVVIMLSSNFMSPRVKLRYEITRKLLDKASVNVQIINGKGKNQIAEMMSLVYLGDYVSYYLAILNQTAPGPVKAIDYLKSELEHHK